jgi:hypothetical protein
MVIGFIDNVEASYIIVPSFALHGLARYESDAVQAAKES